MLSNRSSGAEDETVPRGSGIRRLTKRKTDSGPKVSRLGAKKLESGGSSTRTVRKLGDRTPKSDRSAAPSEAGSEEWSEIGSEELNSMMEPVAEKKSMYKCGPVDKEEVMSRLRAQNREPTRREADWVIEERVKREILPKDDEVSTVDLELID